MHKTTTNEKEKHWNFIKLAREMWNNQSIMNNLPGIDNLRREASEDGN